MAAYQFKITLQGIHPPIWRRIQVPTNSTLHEFALAILDSMQWFGISYFRFVVEKSILVPYYEGDDYMRDTHVTPMNCLIGCRDIEFEYTLPEDEGAGWMHTLEYEGEVSTTYEGPRCMDGARGCPPDDLKGCARAYEDFLKIVMDPSHPERDATLYFNFAGPDFDSERFDINTVRFRRAGPPGTTLEYWD